MKLSHSKKIQKARKLELVTVIALILFACAMGLKFKKDCEIQRGKHYVIKSPNKQILKTVSAVRSANN